jgi:hypothetical protein
LAIEADRPLLYQIQQFEALILILLRHAHHEAQIGRHHPIAGPLTHADPPVLLRGALLWLQRLQLFARLHMMSQLDFLGRRE